jgi:hypothetical protein
MFRQKGKVFIFGREPVRVDILTSPDALEFDACYARRNEVEWDGVLVPLISFDDLRENKRGSGRPKDIADLENLPTKRPKRAGTRRRKRKA